MRRKKKKILPCEGFYFCEIFLFQTESPEATTKVVAESLWVKEILEIKPLLKQHLPNIVDITIWNSKKANLYIPVEVDKIISHIKLGQDKKMRDLFFVQGGPVLYSGQVNKNKETKELIHILKEIAK